MAKDKRSELLKSMGLDEEAMFGNHERSKEEREFDKIIEKAVKENRVPSECVEWIPIADSYMVKTVIFKEC